MMYSSRYRDDGDVEFSPSEISPASSVTAPPMSTFRTLNTFQNMPGRRGDDAHGDDGFTEGHFIDEQMDRDDYLHNMDQFTQRSHVSTNAARKFKCPMSIALITLVVLMGLFLILGFLLPSSKTEDTSMPDSSHVDTSNNQTSNGTVSLSPSSTPTTMSPADNAANTNSTEPPKKHPQPQINRLIDLATMWSGEDALADPKSSTGRAVQWLLFIDPNQLIHNDTVSDLFVQQRYVSAVLYFALLDATQDIPTKVFHGTFLSGVDVCYWNNLQGKDAPGDTTRGILCDAEGIIRELQFQGLGVSGTLPMELSYLSSLVKLNFEENALSGSIPANFSSLLELETMDLRNCSLTGTLPPELSDLHENLEVMLLSNNNLTGSVPSSWSALTGLRRLDLAFNDLTGELSPEFKDLQLEILRLNGNTFSGSLDEAFCTDHPVESLTADCLDPETNIDCSCCAFCCNAKGLECTSTAPDPGSPGGGTLTPDALNEKMETLLLLLEPISGDALKDSNSHQSKVIHWMAQMDHNSPYFEDMDVDSMIQMYIMILIYVATEGMSWNSNRGWLNGTDICSWQGISCNEANLVTEINLAEHNLIGTLVSEIGVLGSSLQSLILKDNPSLTGDLPSEVGQLTKLSTLDVSGCKFSGHLPHEVGGLSSISFFNIEKNSFSGSLPSEIINGMGRAKTLLLGSNGFTGKIPVEIAGIESLERLTMSGCSFSGAIPPQLSTLSSLSYLDLSQNALDGSIPSNLGSLTDLEKLLLDSNPGITGTVPEELAFLPRLKEISVHGTAVIGNLDLLFCTGEVEEVTSNCLDPMVICTCCSMCCDASGRNCKEP